MDIPLRCTCGQVRGTAVDVHPDDGNRIICLCDDCQAYLVHLEREDLLDAHGGTDLFQMASGKIRITEGMEHVRCLRLSEKGLVRWYAGCCKTPIGNTLATPGLPFVGVVHAFMDHAGHGKTRDASLGPVLVAVQSKFAVNGTPANGHPSAPLGYIARTAKLFLRWKLRGQGKGSPFFRADTGALAVTPEVLDPAARETLRQRTLGRSVCAAG
jgi:hypothetical protein